MQKIVLILIFVLLTDIAFAQSVKERLRRARMEETGETSSGKTRTSNKTEINRFNSQKQSHSLDIQARNEDDIDKCQEIDCMRIRSECFHHFAVKKKDLSICTDMVENNLVRAECYANLAAIRKDIDICEIEKDLSQICYGWLSEKMANKTVCDRIVDTRTKDKCLMLVAFENNDLDMCNDLATPSMRNYCINLFEQQQN